MTTNRQQRNETMAFYWLFNTTLWTGTAFTFFHLVRNFPLSLHDFACKYWLCHSHGFNQIKIFNDFCIIILSKWDRWKVKGYLAFLLFALIILWMFVKMTFTNISHDFELTLFLIYLPFQKLNKKDIVWKGPIDWENRHFFPLYKQGTCSHVSW